VEKNNQTNKTQLLPCSEIKKPKNIPPKSNQRTPFLVVLKYDIFQQQRYTIVTLTNIKLERV